MSSIVAKFLIILLVGCSANPQPQQVSEAKVSGRVVYKIANAVSSLYKLTIRNGGDVGNAYRFIVKFNRTFGKEFHKHSDFIEMNHKMFRDIRDVNVLAKIENRDKIADNIARAKEIFNGTQRDLGKFNERLADVSDYIDESETIINNRIFTLTGITGKQDELSALKTGLIELEKAQNKF